ncbi:MAG: ABC transporter permease [Candidatus Latescibacteria bacterium]|nr:ABC transporter permease [Candidatus Latescibacterota bacterium]
MGKTFAVIKREYEGIIKKKSFIISTLMLPLIMGLVIVLPTLLAQTEPEEQRRIALVDSSGTLSADITKALTDTLNDGRRRYLIVEAFPTDSAQLDRIRSALSRDVEDGRLDAYLIVERNFEKNGRVDYCAEHVTNFTELSRLENALSSIVIERRLRREGLDPKHVKELTKGVDLRTVRLSGKVETEREIGGTYISLMIFVMILYMTVMLYGVSVMRGIIDDKTHRVVEILLSSLTPFQLMMGKLIGIGAAGLTQSAIWVTLAGLFSTYSQHLFQFPFSAGTLPITMLLFFIAFYLLGYFLYAGLYTVVGAICSSEQDAQNVQFPIVLLLVIPIMLNFYLIQNPGSTVATVLSLIPFFAPVMMFMRINTMMPPAWEIIICFVLLLLTIVLCLKLSAKIFRVGILMYGKRATLREIATWVRYR